MDLKDFREKNDLSQVAMAVLLEVSIGSYLNWERRVMFPNKENQIKIDELFKKYEK